MLQALEKLVLPKFTSRAWCESPCDLHPAARVPHKCGNRSVYAKVDKLKGGTRKLRYEGAAYVSIAYFMDIEPPTAVVAKGREKSRGGRLRTARP